MAQTLKYLDQLLAGYPDNTAGLISAENIRDHLVSTIGGRGLIENTANFTIPITSGVWTSINQLLPSPIHSEVLWTFDGNNLLHSNYGIGDTVVPVGYVKLGQFLSIIELTKPGGGSDNYALQFTKNNVGVGQPESVEFGAAGTQTITLLHPALVDLSVPSDTFGVQIQGTGTSADLECGYFTLQISDSLLLAAP